MTAVGGSQPSEAVPVRVIEDVTFASVAGIELQADIYLPDNPVTPPPVLVYLHGGGWRLGNHKMDVEMVLRPLASRGLAVVSVDYRLSDVASFPDQIHDAKAAVRWVKANASTYGWDANRVAASGSSTGGHLAGLLGLTADVAELEGEVGDDKDVSSSVNAVVLYYPVVDPAQWDHENFNRGPQPPADTFAGRYPAWPPPPRAALMLGVADAATAPGENARASVPSYVSAENPPPFLILHGDADSAVFITHSKQLHAALKSAGADSALLILAGADHVDPAYGRPEITGAVAAFIRDALGPYGES